MAEPSLLAALPLLFTVGVLLMALEFNLPGRILPGCIGLFATLWALASLWRLQQPAAVACLFAGLAISAFDLWRANRTLSVCATLAYLTGFLLAALPTRAPAAIILAALCSLFLGATLAKLSRLAELARTTKRQL